MRYLKRFEESIFDEDLFWLVDPNNRFDVVMFKLKMSDDNVRVFNSVPVIEPDFYDGMIFIAYTEYNNWFSWDNATNRNREHLNKSFKYMGELHITQKDIDEYELFTSVNKYNL